MDITAIFTLIDAVLNEQESNGTLTRAQQDAVYTALYESFTAKEQEEQEQARVDAESKLYYARMSSPLNPDWWLK